jgi:hypothetical protein
LHEESARHPSLLVFQNAIVYIKTEMIPQLDHNTNAGCRVV